MTFRKLLEIAEPRDSHRLIKLFDSLYFHVHHCRSKKPFVPRYDDPFTTFLFRELYETYSLSNSREEVLEQLDDSINALSLAVCDLSSSVRALRYARSKLAKEPARYWGYRHSSVDRELWG